MVSHIKEILKRAKSRGMSNEEIRKCLIQNGYSLNLLTDKKTDEEIPLDPIGPQLWRYFNCLMFKVYPIIFALVLLSYPLFKMVTGSPCLLQEISPFGEAVTPIVDCKICEGVTEAPRLVNITQDDFIRNYAYTSRPVLVVGAVSNWSAVDIFSYDYFKSLYMNAPESLEEDHNKGQFFAYSSNIRDLKDLFSLPSEVATMETEKWYIGW